MYFTKSNWYSEFSFRISSTICNVENDIFLLDTDCSIFWSIKLSQFLFCEKSKLFFLIYLIIFVLSICIFSDIGGYIFGKSIGGKKLTKISPNKTISGSVGSFIFSLVPIVLFNFDLTFSLLRHLLLFLLNLPYYL